MAPRRRIELEHQRDFTGGLNLKEDPYNLASNETFELQNVDIDRRGGFGVRRGMRRFIEKPVVRRVTATGASRTANIVTATGLSPLNGDPDGLKPGMAILANFPDASYNGNFTVATAVGGASTATWSQVAADDASAGAGQITETFGTPDSGYTYVDPSNVRHILIAREGKVKRWDGSAWQDVVATTSGPGGTAFVEMDNVLYIHRPVGKTVPFTWSGSGLATQLTTAVGNYNDDLTAPNQGNFPACRTFAVHAEVMWAGGVVDATAPGTADSRIRWSHPGQPQDWRTNDFIDLDPDDENGAIRALVPFGDRLLVFKDKAIYAIHGYPPAGFSVQNLTKEIGCPHEFAVVATETEVYFWDRDTGAWRYDGRGFEWVFEPLYRLIDDEILNTAFSQQTNVFFHRERAYFHPLTALTSVYKGTTINLVYQRNRNDKTGSWTLHIPTHAFGSWVHRGSEGGDEHLLGGGFPANFYDNTSRVYELDVENLYEDQEFTEAGLFRKINAHYVTRWYDAGNPAIKKRWKRPVVIMRGGAAGETQIDVLGDYDPTHVIKTFSIFTPASNSGTLVWTEPNSEWDDEDWAAESTLSAEKAVLLKGSPLGSSTARALRFRNIEQGQDWRVWGLTMKWIPKLLRN